MPIHNHTSSSSMMTHFNYNTEEKTLQIKMAKGGWYEYADVPHSVYEAMLNSDSHGKYFLAHIKGKYAHTKM